MKVEVTQNAKHIEIYSEENKARQLCWLISKLFETAKHEIYIQVVILLLSSPLARISRLLSGTWFNKSRMIDREHVLEILFFELAEANSRDRKGIII